MVASSLLRSIEFSLAAVDLSVFVGSMTFALALHGCLCLPITYALATRKPVGTFMKGMAFPIITSFGIISR